jgi:hypothetical protein
MTEMEPFAVFDSSLALLPIGRSCSNLRELLEGIRTVPDMVIEHHMMRCALQDPFELYEFPNDLALWCWDVLGDQLLAEQLALIDPYHHESIEALRAALIDVIESRLWESDRIPWARPGLELHFVGSRLVAYDTGERLPTPAALAEAMPRLPLASIFYHVHNARRRTGGRSDDFSLWLEQYGAEPALIARVRAVDFHFLNLNQVRSQIAEAFRQSQPAAELVAPAAAS